MDASAKLGNNFGPKGLKCGFIRLGDDGENVSTTDVYIGSGTGAPNGAYNLPTGATALCLREDAAGSGTVAYVTHDGGTTWTALTNTAFDPQDSEQLTFGTGDDIAIAWDGTRLNVTQAAVNSEVRWGVDGAGIDQMWYGDTASAYMTWDQSADSLILSGVAKIKLQTITAAAAAAIPVTHSGSLAITQNGAETNTLADPTYLGQTISIFVDTDTSGARVITAASRINQTGNNTITLTEVGDFIKLEAITIGGALKWQVVANDGASLSTV